MFFSNYRAKCSAHNQIDSLIGAGVSIVGSVTFSGCLYLEGRITGHVQASSDQTSVLVVGNEGQLRGEVQAAHVKVFGRVDGPIRALGSLLVHANAQINGNIEYSLIEVHDGAQLLGVLHANAPKQAKNREQTVVLDAIAG